MKPEDEWKLDREIKLLSRLKDFPVKIPDYSYISVGSPLFAGYPYIPGKSLNSVSMLNQALLGDMVNVIRRMAEFNVELVSDIGLPTYTPDSWFERQQNELRRFEGILSGFTGSGFFRDVFEELDSAMATVPESSMGLVHADMYRGNVIISPSEDRINGIIDWEDSIIADPALDIAALGLDFGRNGTRALINAIGWSSTDDTIEERVNFYQRIEVLYLAEHSLESGEPEKAKQLMKSAASRKI